MTPEAIAPLLAAAWQRARGHAPEISDMRQLSSGASSLTLAFEATLDQQRHRFVAQLFAGGDQFVGALTKKDQAQTQRLAAESGIQTPKVVLTVGEPDGLEEGFVSRHVDGETLGKRIANDAAYADARTLLPAQCAHTLAQIHALDTQAFAFLPVRDARRQLDELTTLHRSYGESLPVFEAAFARLASQLPSSKALRLVHGDFRNGNLLVQKNGLAGVLDWELAHLGDPMEDLGWLCMRSWRFGRDTQPVGGFGQRADFYKAYEAASGVAVDPAAVHQWEMLGTLKWGVICQWFAHRRLSGAITGLEPAVIGRRVSEVELQLLDLLQGRGY